MNRKTIEVLKLEQFGPRVHQLVDRLYLFDARGLRGEPLAELIRNLEAAHAIQRAYSKQAYTTMAEEGVVDLVDEITAQRKEAFQPDYGDLLNLYLNIRELKPHFVVEYGSGWSTYILAHALRQNGHGRLISIDGHPHWADVNAKALPARFRDICEIRYSQPDIKITNGQAAYIHDHVPNGIPDLIYVDGPGCSPPAIPVGADATLLEERLRPGATVLVDGRHDNVLYLLRTFKRSWAIEAYGLRCVEDSGQAKELLILSSKFTLVPQKSADSPLIPLSQAQPSLRTSS